MADTTQASAPAPAASSPPTENKAENKAQPPTDVLSVTQHTATVGGKTLRYTVTCGTMVLKEEAEKKDKSGEFDGEREKATMFFVAYTLDGVTELKKRPLTISFNGGPGSSSVWLHLGVLGPRRVHMDDEGNLPKPPYELINNEYSILDETDLVFIDPVGTGYSRAAVGEKNKEFFGFQKDIESVGDFIRVYCTRYGRWISPKFLIGESYGTTRAAGLSGYLQERHGMYLNGIMLISSILNFQTARFEPGNDLPYICFLPTYTATAWHHKKLDEKLQRNLGRAINEARAFAAGEYATALMQGAALPEAHHTRIAARLAQLTGLTQDYIERTNLRINIHRFCKELLRSERKTVGRLDSRFTAHDRDAAGEEFEFDPSMASILGPYTAVFYDYVRGALKFESDLPYEILSIKVNQAWSYAEFENRYVNVAETLRKAMNMNPHLKVYVANGYYDLATPFFATEYTMNHLELEPRLQKNISMGYFAAGHMMYVQAASLQALKKDLARFVKGAA